MSAADSSAARCPAAASPVTGNDIDTDRIIPARFPEGRHLRGMG